MRTIHILSGSGAIVEITVPEEPILRRPSDELTLEERMAAVQRYIQKRYINMHLDGLDGMIIGSVEGVHITDDTPMDPDQWEDGQPWIWKKT